MKPYFIMLVGIPGSGKSRWAKEIRSKNTVIVCPDEIRKKLTGDISNQEFNSRVWFEAKLSVMNLLESGKNVILDATNVNTMYREDFMLGLRSGFCTLLRSHTLPDCTLIAKLFEIAPEIAYEYIQKDLKLVTKMAKLDPSIQIIRANVPEYVIYRMYGEYLYTKRVIKDEGFEVTVIDNRFAACWITDIKESKKRFGTERHNMDKPRYKHDCNKCHFLGQYEKYDLYFCPKEPTVVARYSNEGDGYNYNSGMVFAITSSHHHYREALIRALRISEFKGKIIENFIKFEFSFPERKEGFLELLKIAETDPKDYPLIIGELKYFVSYIEEKIKAENK